MRLTKRGKRCLLFVLVAILATIVTALSIVASANNEAKEYITYIVQPNDTLWGIAEEYGTDGDVRKTIYEIKKVNQMESSDLVVGAELLIAVS